MMTFVGIFSAGIPTSILGKAISTPSYKDALRSSGDFQTVTSDFRSVAKDMRVGVKKTKESNVVR
ncbi:MAG: hypothetical protein RJB43_57 [Verrucomicrobiota bacterium]